MLEPYEHIVFGVSMCWARLQQQRYLTNLRLVCKEFADKFKPFVFAPTVHLVDIQRNVDPRFFRKCAPKLPVCDQSYDPVRVKILFERKRMTRNKSGEFGQELEAIPSDAIGMGCPSLRQSFVTETEFGTTSYEANLGRHYNRGHDDSQPLPNVFHVASYRNEYTQLKSSGNFMIPIYFRGNFFEAEQTYAAVDRGTLYRSMLAPYSSQQLAPSTKTLAPLQAKIELGFVDEQKNFNACMTGISRPFYVTKEDPSKQGFDLRRKKRLRRNGPEEGDLLLKE